MALNINNATIGYDANEVQTALNNIRTDVIGATQDALRQNMNSLREAVDNVWVGQSAENFKSNMSTDMEAICSYLDEAYESLKNELNQITNEMSQIDENLVEKRSE